MKASHLQLAYGTKIIYDDCSFNLEDQDKVGIVGVNGAGKTTLLRLLATLERPTTGTMRVGGADAKEDPGAVRRRIGLVSHSSMLYPDLTAEENLAFYGELYGVGDPVARAVELLDAVGLKHRRHDRVRTFSRGMVQRTAIARALVHVPRIVLLDEPFSGLDPQAAQAFESLLSSVRQGRTFCMVSHDLEKGCSLATHALLMAKGKGACFTELGDSGYDRLRVRYDGLAAEGMR